MEIFVLPVTDNEYTNVSAVPTATANTISYTKPPEPDAVTSTVWRAVVVPLQIRALRGRSG